MKKVELVEAIAKKVGITKAEAGRALDSTFEDIAEALEKGDTVRPFNYDRACRTTCRQVYPAQTAFSQAQPFCKIP